MTICVYIYILASFILEYDLVLTKLLGLTVCFLLQHALGCLRSRQLLSLLLGVKVTSCELLSGTIQTQRGSVLSAL